MKKKKSLSAYFYILPMFLFFAFFLVYPLFNTIRISFFEWNGIDPEMHFVGFQNYIDMFHDEIFYKAFANFAIYAVLVIVLEMLIGFSLAYLMRRKNIMFNIYRAIIFIPVILLPVVISYVFTDILAYNYGIVNETLRALHLDKLALDWFADPNVALYTLIGITVWSGTGFAMTVYSSSLTSFPSELIDAAKVDGANRIQTVTRVVWPLLKGTHFSLSIISAISALKIFDLVFLLTGGGPFHATEMPSTYMYDKAFTLYEQGFASAVSTIIIIFALLVTFIQTKLSAEKR
ncbi:sugar ABC transporter permease [Muricomes intestini]|uniref:carbohydrate ABC transporter permease n=1 Tax=Muricomes intestini TaxID=1796634 RepID=UPI000E981B43|nr:sugar ABC transporter permease [Lachnospiraceae bacterium]HCR84352.1 sugar ABC transporter permease [Lachnospiraceae bacterium]